MAKNGNSHQLRNGGDFKPKPKASQFVPFKYVNCELTSNQKQELRTAIHEGVVSDTQAFELLSEGYKLSCVSDDRNGCIIATLIDKRENSPYVNSCLSARGATASIALCTLYYKHHFVLKGNWAVVNEVPNDDWGIG